MKRLRPNPRDYPTKSVRTMPRKNVFPEPGFPLGVFPSLNQGLLDYHVHEDFTELVLVTEGSGVHEIAGQSYPIIAGDVFLVLGDLVHCYSEGFGLAIVNVIFNWEELGLPQFDVGELAAFQSLFVIDPVNTDPDRFDHRFRLETDDFNTVLHLVNELDDLLNRHPARPGRHFLALSRFMELIARLLEAYERTADSGVTAGIPHRLGALVGMLEKNYAENITVETMCRQTGMSYASLFRHFRHYYNDTPVNYLIGQRLRRAEELLRKRPELAVGEIALAAGFGDSAYFSRKFSEHYGLAPSAYRREHGNSGAAADRV